MSALNAPAPVLSTRGNRALARPPLLRCALFENQFSPSNPDGLINLGVAENSLMTEWLITYFREKQFAMTYSDFTYGSALGGSLRLFSALKTLTSRYFNARVPVEREDVIAGSGCGSVIDLLVSCIADEGDGILVSKPFYNGFSASFECRNNVIPVGVELVDGHEADIEGIDAFEAALVESEKKGITIRAVMLCNPNNPLGFCYSPEVLLAYCRFVQKHNLHLIVDEIYALSTFSTPENPNAQQFTSILALDPLADAGCDLARIHAIYGSSKDWSSNGLRIGALISQANPDLHASMESSCLLMKISSAADILWSGLLLDAVGLPAYVNLNRERLANSYARAVSFLKAHSIPYRLSNAGHFIFIDLRKFLPTHDMEGKALSSPTAQEEELAARFMRYGVIVARGAAYSMPIAGWFRLTFTLRSDYFEIGLQRLETALGLSPTVSVDLVRSMSGEGVVENGGEVGLANFSL